MKYTSRPLLLFSLLAFSALGFNENGPLAPQTESVEPRIGKPGTIIKIKGKSLDKSHVDEVYLTDHRFDMKVKILDQSAGQLTIRVPPFAKPGRLQLLILTAGNNPAYLEQPWFIQIDSGDEDLTPPPAEISHTQKSKPTVEVASNGSAVPVPLAGAPPAPATTSGLEKSVVPLKSKSKAKPAPEPPADPVQQAAIQQPVAQPVQQPVQQAAPPPVQQPVQQAVQQPVQPPPAAVPNSEPQATPAPKSAVNTPASTDPGNIPAQILQKTRVSYPPAAMAQRLEGTVEILAVVGEDGHVKSTKVLKGNPYLASAATASIREWIYEPAQLHGKPVQSEVNVVLNFKRPQ